MDIYMGNYLELLPTQEQLTTEKHFEFCPNCNHHLNTPFCPECGSARIEEDKKIVMNIHQFTHNLLYTLEIEDDSNSVSADAYFPMDTEDKCFIGMNFKTDYAKSLITGEGEYSYIKGLDYDYWKPLLDILTKKHIDYILKTGIVAYNFY